MDAGNLPVTGELPADLVGGYFRNGPNPVHQPKNRHHPFDGDGMLHGVYFKDGQVSYRIHRLTQAVQRGRLATEGAPGDGAGSADAEDWRRCRISVVGRFQSAALSYPDITSPSL